MACNSFNVGAVPISKVWPFSTCPECESLFDFDLAAYVAETAGANEFHSVYGLLVCGVGTDNEGLRVERQDVEPEMRGQVGFAFGGSGDAVHRHVEGITPD